jgi:signal transduction histidine kinase
MTSDELMERFARGDSSRGSEGNGLGLSIAQSLMEIMNGQFRIVVDGDLFKAIMLFPRITNETPAAEEPTDAQAE